MYNKASVLFLAAVFLCANSHILLAQSDVAAGDLRIKAQVNKLGAGSKVTVTLKDGTKVRGSISQILDDSFDVTLERQTQSSIISYRNVQDVRRRGWSSAAKVGLGIGLGVGAIVVVLGVMLASVDL